MCAVCCVLCAVCCVCVSGAVAGAVAVDLQYICVSVCCLLFVFVVLVTVTPSY